MATPEPVALRSVEPLDADDDIRRRLENLRALTDTALARLDVDDLLVELLHRVRDILDADTGAVLLLDEASGELLARAACGIEEEVRQGVRVRLGTGFAGRIAATRGPIRLDRVDETTVANPILWEKGIKVMLGVPLLVGDRVVGVLHVGRLEHRPFRAEDAELLEVVAERIAAATNARQLAIEAAAAELLERSLLPPVPPTFPGLEIAARYVPAETQNVGGDWYDVFRLPSGALWVVAGDVGGHGLPAAVVMGRVRSALRAYSLLEAPPEAVLELVDKKVEHFEIDEMVTAVCAVLEPPYDTIRIAAAGHPPPVLVAPGEPAALVPVETGPPLGTALLRQRRAAVVPFASGSVAAFYTDGLVERRGEAIDVGLRRLLDAVVPVAPDLVAQRVMHRLVGSAIPADDIALVVVRRTDDAVD
jgi:phosphoserine phosphatase RsbU/P